MYTTTTTTARTPRTIAAVVVASGLALAAGVAVASPASAAESSLSDLEQSIIYVETSFTGYVEYPTADGGMAWSDPYTWSAQCSGFFVSTEAHIATAGHCVDDQGVREDIIEAFLIDNDAEHLLDVALSSWRVEGYEPGSEIDREVSVIQPAAGGGVLEEWMTAQVVDEQEFGNGDAALLRVAGLDVETPALTIADAAPEVGDELTSIGFPDSVQDVVDVSRLRASFKTGTASSQQVTDQGVAATEINAQVSGGMSGGPTVDADGNVLGINSFGIYGENQSFNFITDTDNLASFLNSNDVPFERAAGSSPDESDEGGSDDSDDSEAGGSDEDGTSEGAGSSGGSGGVEEGGSDEGGTSEEGGDSTDPVSHEGATDGRSQADAPNLGAFLIVAVAGGMVFLLLTGGTATFLVLARRKSARATAAPVAPVASTWAPQPTAVPADEFASTGQRRGSASGPSQDLSAPQPSSGDLHA